MNGKQYGWSDTISHSQANYNSGDGEAYDVSPTSGHHPDYDEGGYPYSSPVGSFSPNAYGLYDMAGNMLEWCSDWEDSAYYASSPSSNPHGPSSGSDRVGRGGGWHFYAGGCRSAFRAGGSPSGSGNGVGFRSVLPAEP